MSRNRRRRAHAQHAPTVDLRAVARALLIGERADPLAIRPEALARIIAVANAEEPFLVAQPDARARAAGSSERRAGVTVIRLAGIITPQPSLLSLLFGGGGGLQGFRSELREALGDDDVTAIVLDVHSPGGSVALVPEVAAEVRQARGEKPIVTVANTLMASAAYWIGAQADEVVITPSGLVGSIGVYLIHDDWSGFNEALGVIPTYVSAGRYKTEGNFDEPLSDEARAALQAEVDDFYDLFVADVAAGRGVTADAVRNGLGEGRVLPAKRAVSAGLGDRIATLDDVIRNLASGAGNGGRARSSTPAPDPRAEDDRDPAPIADVDEAPAIDEAVATRIAELGQLRPPGTY